MDEASPTQQYYIATTASPSDEHAQVLKYGDTFSVFDRSGDMVATGLGEQGIFHRGTRYLSQLALQLWNSRPLLLSSTVQADNFLFAADLSNLDLAQAESVVVPRGTLHLRRSRFLWKNTCYESIKLVNYGLSEVVVSLRIVYAADFADLFEVRGISRPLKGKLLPANVQPGSVRLKYRGLDDVERVTAIESDLTPASTTEFSMNFALPLQPQQEIHFHLRVTCDPDASERLDYESALKLTGTQVTEASSSIPRIQSSNSRFSDWVRRSVADVEMMTIGNREKDYPYAGVPWFSTVFGRDGIITALQMLWLNSSFAKGVLEFLAETQATDVILEAEAEPGKILHEMRYGEMAALKEIPFGRYYGTVDATPLFVMLAAAYYQTTGDSKLIRRIWPNIELALKWIDTYGDVDGDGFIEYSRRSSKGLVQQGWKDSNDSVFHSDGTLADAPIALCEVQGYVYAAKLGAAHLAGVLGEAERAAELGVQAENVRARFEETFWCDDISMYAIALDGKKQPCRVRSSNAGQCLFTGIVGHERALRLAHELLSAEFFTGWGIRTIAAGEARYNPLSYHNGSVWPHDNSLIASGLARYGFKEKAGKILLGLLDLSNQVDLRRLPELFCGIDRRHGEGPTLYPVACSPQAWAAGSVFLVLQACLGVSIDGANNRISITKPYLPEGIPQLRIKGLKSGMGSADLLFERSPRGVEVEVFDRVGGVDVAVS